MYFTHNKYIKIVGELILCIETVGTGQNNESVNNVLYHYVRFTSIFDDGLNSW